MALNSSGPISMGGSTAGESINLELDKSATASISLNDADVRSLLGINSGAISLNAARGKVNKVPFLMLINNNAAKDDNFTLGIQPSPSGSITSLSGTADFNYTGEQTTYLWLGAGLDQSSFLARTGVTAMINTIAAAPVYRGVFSLPLALTLGQAYNIKLTNVQNNANNNYGVILLGISSVASVKYSSGIYAGSSGQNYDVSITLPSGP